ncbi:MAG TPA: hypothetical protein VMW47_13520 [Verrucomicrobiae bacterium]|nr:hypothetical protein [Verrucomicrobiae bacterium]
MARLNLRIDGPPGAIAASVLARVLTESVAILNDLRIAVTHSQTHITWFVDGLKTGSAEVLLVAAPKKDIGETELDRISRAYVDGLDTVETGEALPPYLSEKSLDRIKRMASPLGQGAEALLVSANDNGTARFARVTRHAVANIKALMAPRSQALGSVTGRLEAISLHYKTPKFHIYDDLANRPVGCHFPEESLEAVKAGLGKRVRIGGTVTRNAKGQAISVDQPVIAPVGAGRPLSDLVALDPGFTEGRSLAEYMEEYLS